MQLPERAGPWTVPDVLALGEDTSHRVEMVGGVLLLTPRPGVVHQRAAHRLAVPDITVVRAAAAAGERSFVEAGDVLLAVEITTADTAVADRVTRPVLYVEAGIRHLWRLGLEPAPHLWVGTLEDGVYATVARIPAGRSARVPAPVAVQLDPADLAAPPAR